MEKGGRDGAEKEMSEERGEDTSREERTRGDEERTRGGAHRRIRGARRKWHRSSPTWRTACVISSILGFPLSLNSCYVDQSAYEYRIVVLVTETAAFDFEFWSCSKTSEV